MKRKILFQTIICGLLLLLGTMSAVAQTNSYQQTNLVSDMAGVAPHTDPKLINPWGISFVLVSRSGFPITTAVTRRFTMPTVLHSLLRF